MTEAKSLTLGGDPPVPGWKDSDRRERLPEGWDKIRAKILKRDGGRCTFIYPNGGRCPEEAKEVDHFRNKNVLGYDDDSEDNLRSLCTRHHRMKSGAEGAAALHKARALNRTRFRRSESHPGAINND